MSNREYLAPDVEVLYVAIELGYAASNDDGNLESPEDGGEI